ncbi:hypothetical protein Pst134EB_026168 [Puccinia striiformis f. sp. tritici]|nr:hypothetical protein Pst134EB_026168 [Puccinia striiformis f. sp. tritici]
MQEFGNKLHIRRSVEMVLDQFGDGAPLINRPTQSEILTDTNPDDPSPKNTHQNQIHQAAISEKNYVLLPDGKMVVLVDEAGICVGVGVPPDKSNGKKS